MRFFFYLETCHVIFTSSTDACFWQNIYTYVNNNGNNNADAVAFLIGMCVCACVCVCIFMRCYCWCCCCCTYFVSFHFILPFDPRAMPFGMMIGIKSHGPQNPKRWHALQCTHTYIHLIFHLTKYNCGNLPTNSEKNCSSTTPTIFLNAGNFDARMQRDLRTIYIQHTHTLTQIFSFVYSVIATASLGLILSLACIYSRLGQFTP